MTDDVEDETVPQRTPEEIKLQLRLYFIGVCIVGVIMSTIFIGWPIYQAHQGVETVFIYPNLAYGGIALFFFGLVSAILGDIPLPDPATGHLTGKHYLFLGIGSIFILISCYVTNQYFASIGYHDIPKP